MNNRPTKTTIVSSLFWKLLERGGTQGIQFIVQIVLARLLLPEEYGVIAIVNVFILLANVFVQNGLNTALIQKKDVDELDFSSAFYLNVFIAVLLYIFLFLLAPIIGSFFHFPQLKLILRILSITLLFGAVNSVQHAYIAKKMLFKKLFLSSLWSVMISGMVGIILAFQGLGVWALVIQQLISQIIITLILWITVRWRPKLIFSFGRIKLLFKYGWKILISSLLNTLYTDFRTIIIGRLFNASALGYYNRGRQFPQIIVTNINGAIQSVMLPALSLHQDNKGRVKEMMRRSVMSSAFLIFPMMTGLAMVAEPIVAIVLTEKWLPAVPFLQIYCIIFALRPLHTANVQSINALGRSDIYLKIEIFRTVVGILTLIVTVPFGIYAIAIGELVSAIISSFIYIYPNKKLIDYSFSQQVRDVLSPMILSITMGLVVFAVGKVITMNGAKLISQIIVGSVTYISLAVFFKVENYEYIKRTALVFLKKNR